MGKLSADEVVTLLKAAPFRCARGYPGGRMPELIKPALAVNPCREDENSVTMAVNVFSPAEDGAPVCEAYAKNVAEYLRDHGAACTQEECRHDGRGDRFSVRILATWTADSPTVPYSLTLGNGATLNRTVKFSARQMVELAPVGVMGENDPAVLLQKTHPWEFTLEEFYPYEELPPDSPPEPFTFTLYRNTRREQFSGCYWTSLSQEITEKGMHQIRTGRAAGRQVLTSS